MKKIFTAALSFVFAFALFGCADTSSAYAASDASAAFASFDYETELSMFVGGDKNKDRTSFSDESKSAGEYIYARLSGISGMEVSRQDYTVSFQTSGGITNLSAFNVIATYNPTAKKRVTILAHYDNTFGGIEAAGVTGSGTAGIADNATGVVALTSLAEAFATNAPDTDFAVDFVFTGSDEYGFSGTAKYLTEWINSTDDIMLAVNLETIVGDKINVYSDVVSTVQQQVFVGSGEVYATVFKPSSKTAPLLPVGLTGSSEYSDYGQLSGAADFVSRGVPVVSLFGWKTDGFGYYQPETDNYSDFVTNHAEFGSVAKDVCSLTYGVITDPRFTATSEKFTAGEGYGFFNGGYFAYLAYLGLIIILCVVLVPVVKKLSKKHGNGTVNPTRPGTNVKIAVFGPEYEDAGDGDVIVDIRDEKPNDPFEDKDD